MTSSLLNKYLRNECTPVEVEEVLRWLQQEADTEAGKQILRESWETIPLQESPPEVDFENLLDRLHHRINLTVATPESRLNISLPRAIVRYLIRAAAILFLPILTILILTYSRGELLFTAGAEKEWIEITTPAGSKTTFNLPDGTLVWLNHESTLRYPQRFEPGEREVELSGEAYFEVTSDPEHPFRVHSGQLDVVAVGTEFNVLAYPEDTTMEITLIAGRVDIRRKIRNDDRTLYQMEPDEHLLFQKRARKLVPSAVSSDKYTAWKEGKLIFENDPISNVIERLSRWFNVDFELEDPDLSNYTYTATFVSETLPQVLELMELASPIEYKITPRALQSDGSFSKMKVIIRKK
ncbi:MAG: DUF4974 domain-containing protein [Saprospiraceae bacterium]|nr:DUF4974 domain-containing protein [Lewinella sp.]